MLTDRELEQIAMEKGVAISREELEDELGCLHTQATHQRQYAALARGCLPEDGGAAEGSLAAQAARNLRIRRLLDDTIREQGLSVTGEELLSEAQALAQRQGVSLDMVRGFFGEDFGMLRRDVLEKKALARLEEQHGAK